MGGLMNPAEFANIAAGEREFWWYRGMRAILFRVLDSYLGERPAQQVLEAGCGTGYLARLLETQRGWPVTALDLAPDGLKYARALGVKRPVQGDLRSLPFPAGGFDLILAIDVLAHLPRGDEILAARELARVLAPGGLLAVRTAALDFLRSRHSQFAGERQRFTRGRLLDLFTSAGLEVLRCSYANALLLPAAALKFRVWEPLLRRPPASGIQPLACWLDRLLYAALAAEAAWLGRGHDLPAGQSLILIARRPA